MAINISKQRENYSTVENQEIANSINGLRKELETSKSTLMESSESDDDVTLPSNQKLNCASKNIDMFMLELINMYQNLKMEMANMKKIEHKNVLLVQELSRLQKSCDDANKEKQMSDEIRSKLDEMNKKLSLKLEESSKKQKDANAKLLDLQEQVANANKDNQIMQQLVSDLEKEKDDLLVMMKKMMVPGKPKNNDTTAEAQKENFKRFERWWHSEQLIETLGKTEGQMASLQKEYDFVIEDKKTLRKINSELSKELSEKSERTLKLTCEKETLTAELINTQDLTAVLREKIDELEALLQEKTSEIESEKAILSSELKCMQEATSDLSKRNEALKAVVDENTSKFESEKAMLGSELKRSLEVTSDLRERNGELKGIVDLLRCSYQMINRRSMFDAEEESRCLCSKESSGKQNKIKIDEISTINIKIEELQRQHKMLVDQLDTCKGDNNNLRIEDGELKKIEVEQMLGEQPENPIRDLESQLKKTVEHNLQLFQEENKLENRPPKKDWCF